jgi:outer membrane immunogenic protein
MRHGNTIQDRVMKRIALSLLAFTALTGAAVAADLPSQKAPEAPPPIPAFVWTGFYGGVQAGGDFGQTAFSLPASGYQKNWGNSGVFGGGHFGYNYQIQQLVVGVQGEFDVQDDKGSGTDNTTFAPAVFTGASHHDWFASADARIGYAVKNYLVYAIGGYAFSDNTTSITANGSQVAGRTNSLNGYDIGGGVEYAFTPKWSGLLEYRYYQYAANTNAYAASTRLFTEKPSESTVRVGLSYHWGAAEPTPVVAAAPPVVKP